MSRLRPWTRTAERSAAATSSWPRASSGEIGSKTAMGVIRYGRDAIVAVLDSTRAGGNVRE